MVFGIGDKGKVEKGTFSDSVTKIVNSYFTVRVYPKFSPKFRDKFLKSIPPLRIDYVVENTYQGGTYEIESDTNFGGCMEIRLYKKISDEIEIDGLMESKGKEPFNQIPHKLTVRKIGCKNTYVIEDVDLHADFIKMTKKDQFWRSVEDENFGNTNELLDQLRTNLNIH